MDVRCLPLTAPYGCGTRRRKRSYTIIQIETEDGRVGLGEPYAGVNAPSVCCSAVELLKHVLVGQNAYDYREIIPHLQHVCEYFDHRGFFYCVLGALDWAFHDLAAQRANLPLHRFLNPDSSSSVGLYASAGPAADPPEAVADAVAEYYHKGFRATKVRAGGCRFDEDHASKHVRAIFDRVQQNIQIAVDLGQQIFFHGQLWHRDDAARFIGKVSDLDILFLEDPLLIHDMEGYCELSCKSRIPIAGGEMFAEVEPFQAYMLAGAIDVVQPDASVLAGPVQILEVGRLAGLYGKKMVMHSWAGPIAQLQNIHAALAIEACDFVEYCTLEHTLLEEELRPIWQFVEGRLLAPTTPGIGIFLGEDVSRRYPFENVSTLIA